MSTSGLPQPVGGALWFLSELYCTYSSQEQWASRSLWNLETFFFIRIDILYWSAPLTSLLNLNFSFKVGINVSKNLLKIAFVARFVLQKLFRVWIFIFSFDYVIIKWRALLSYLTTVHVCLFVRKLVWEEEQKLRYRPQQQGLPHKLYK